MAAAIEAPKPTPGDEGPLPEFEPTTAEGRPLPLYDDQPQSAPEATKVWTRPAHEGKVRAGVLLFAALMLLPNLGAFGLWDPWETHYGAVTTHMVETYDWVSPWWGYKEQIGTEPRQGEPFFSKPIFIFWSEAFFVRLVGHGEWAIRLPMAVLAIMAVFMTYLAMSKIWSRRAGLIGAVVMATSPQFFMISRQAQTDMPFVGTMIIALMFLMLAFFGPRERLSRRGFWAWTWGTLAFVLLSTLPQYGIITADLSVEGSDALSGAAWWSFQLANLKQAHLMGWLHATIYGVLLAGVLAWYAFGLRRDLRDQGLTDAVKDKWVRRYLMVLFYVMAAMSTYAKGLLGFMLPGAIIFVYLLVSGHWRALARAELIRGILVFIATGFPWYMAMFAKHGMAYYQRFFIHDHFNRLGAGVHQIDSGNFEHFIKWLGIGMFPWMVFVPLALVWLVRQRARAPEAGDQAKLFATLWFVVAFTLFTISSTKFHHYIFPAMPALAVLTALFLDHLLDNRGWLARLAVVVGVVTFAAVAWDLHEDPQHIRNLMTYKYDRPLPEHLPIDAAAPVAAGSTVTWADSTFWRHTSPTLQAILTTPMFRYHTFVLIVSVMGLIALGLFFAARTRRAGLVALGLTASALTMWSLNYYMPSLSPHWSQKYLFDSYYDTCNRAQNHPEVVQAYRPVLASIGLGGVSEYFRGTEKKVCQEDVISWLITWRGETYYSYNELQPITKEQPQFLPYLEERNHGRKFYALMERGKMGGFESKLQSYSKKLKRKGVEGWRDIDSWKVEVVGDESLFFQMVAATPIRE